MCFYLYEKNILVSSVNELRYRVFTKKNSSGDHLPSTLDALFLQLLHLSKKIKCNIEKTLSMHKIPLYIKQFFFL